MILRKFKTPGIAHVAYLIGDRGEAAIVDPRRDVDEYLSFARQNGLRIRWVVETHRQEDFVFGSAELAKITGAKIVTGDHELFGHGDIQLRDGERLPVAGMTLQALHTPGHTPESTCYAVYLPDAPKRAWAAFTGDTLFIGETGRTDLTDRRRTGENAALLFDVIHQKLLPLGDQTILLAAHGSGSVCGGNIAERDDSTIGFERSYNPVFVKSRDEFVAAKIRERIPRPPYFQHMEKVNLRGGLPPGKKPSAVPLLSPKDFASESKLGVVIDAREPEAFAGGHLPGSLSIWLAGLPVFGGWLADENSRIFLVLDRIDDLESALLHLSRIGIDGVEGVLAKGFEGWRDAGLPIERSDTISARELGHSLDRHAVLDVRDDSEFEDEGHIPGATHLYVGYLDQHLRRVEQDLKGKPVAVVCSVGHRAGVATSILRRHGFGQVANVLGGMTAWEKLELPTRKGAERTVTTPDIEGERK